PEMDVDFGSMTGGINHPPPTGATSSFSDLVGLAPVGAWILRIADDTNGAVGSLASWSLTLTVTGSEAAVIGTASDDTLLVNATGPISRAYILNGQTPVVYEGLSGFLTFNAGDGNDTFIVHAESAGGTHGFIFNAGSGNDMFLGDAVSDLAR